MSGAKSLTGQSRTAGWALVDVHPEYLCFDGAVASTKGNIQLGVTSRFLEYVNPRYNGAFWNKTPREVAQLADMGHSVTGADLQETKVSLINAGKSPVIQPALGDLILRGVDAGRLQATQQLQRLGDISLICVGTSSNVLSRLGSLAH